MAKNKNKTKIALVVDRSGSMTSIRKETINGINEQINAIKSNADLGGKTEVTYIQFDNEIEQVFQCSAKKVRPITNDQYSPRGTTALYDAMKTAIDTLSKDADENTAFLVVVVTDGYENASRMVSGKSLSSLIKELEGTGQWTFTYMMSNVDVFKFAKDFNVPVKNISQFVSTDAADTMRGYSRMAGSTMSYMADRAAVAGAYSTSEFYGEDLTDEK